MSTSLRSGLSSSVIILSESGLRLLSIFRNLFQRSACVNNVLNDDDVVLADVLRQVERYRHQLPEDSVDSK